MTKDEARHLLAYLKSFTQVQFPDGFSLESIKQGEPLFNGKDLTGWEGSSEVWSVENGEIVGKAPQKKNQFIFNKQELTDFRLTLEIS